MIQLALLDLSSVIFQQKGVPHWRTPFNLLNTSHMAIDISL